jgi:hypothetical protein
MNKPVLIFPAGMPRAIEFLGQCQREQRAVVGCSSVANDPSQALYPAWAHLPYVTHEGFGQALRQVIAEHHISSIYTAHPVVWDYLHEHLLAIAPDTPLLNASPAVTELAAFRAGMERAHDVLNRPLPLASPRAAQLDWDAHQLAAMYRHTENIPGMCDHEKVRALYEIARYCPRGDIVEVGSWWGKSAFVLLRLAQCFAIGKLLCVDPWSDAHLVQNDKGALVDNTAARFSAEEAFQVFLVNLLPYAGQDMNYLRMPSTDGARRYRSNACITSPQFASTQYHGGIALLHVDGNHAYDNVKADITAWGDAVLPGGWIVLDDYTWPFGDGPQRTGDEFLREHASRIASAFVMGGALFIQLG